MKLIESGGLLRRPLYLADSIGDLIASRNDILAAQNPGFDEQFRQLNGGPLPRNMGIYDHAADIRIAAVNHDTYRRAEGWMGLRLWDSTGVIFARMPSRLDVWAKRILSGDYQYEVEHWKQMWVHRGVLLMAVYTHHPRDLGEDHQTRYDLRHVFNYSYRKNAPNEQPVLDAQLLGRPASI